MEEYPESLGIADSNGRIPLHYLCKYGALLDTVQLLLNRHPEGVQAADDDGYLPLHLACMNRDNTFDTIRLLILTDPVTLLAKTKRLKHSLLQKCFRTNQSREIKSYVLNSQRMVIQKLSQSSLEEHLPDLVVAEISEFADLWEPEPGWDE